MKTIKRDKVYSNLRRRGHLLGRRDIMQPDFVAEIFRQCHAEGIHTCATPAATARRSHAKNFGTLRPVYFDIKHMNADKA
jgi:pyruvate-formate lyase-activating enzyme